MKAERSGCVHRILELGKCSRTQRTAFLCYTENQLQSARKHKNEAG